MASTTGKKPPNRWSYGDAGDRYPMQDGELWGVGPHRLVAGSFTTFLPALLSHVSAKPSLIYTDPPWTAALLTGFYTKAGLAPIPKLSTFHAFLDHLVQTALKVDAPVIALEMGAQHIDDLARRLGHSAQYPYSAILPITYYRKHPGFLIVVSGRPLPATLSALEGVDDDFTPGLLIEQVTRPGDRILDLCAGRGLTLISAQRTGRVGLGIELNPRRAAVTLDKLAQLTRSSPIKYADLRSTQGLS